MYTGTVLFEITTEYLLVYVVTDYKLHADERKIQRFFTTYSLKIGTSV